MPCFGLHGRGDFIPAARHEGHELMISLLAPSDRKRNRRDIADAYSLLDRKGAPQTSGHSSRLPSVWEELEPLSVMTAILPEGLVSGPTIDLEITNSKVLQRLWKSWCTGRFCFENPLT